VERRGEASLPVAADGDPAASAEPSATEQLIADGGDLPPSTPAAFRPIMAPA